MLGGLARFRLDAPDAARALWSAGALLAVVYYLVPPLRRPAYGAWMRLFRPVGWLVSNGVLALVFFGLVTPMGVVMRAFGRDKLARRLDRDAPSYWSEHDPSSDANRYFRQT